MDDELLIARVLEGNTEVFRLLVLRYQRPLFRFLGLLGFDQNAAEDLAQETFLRAYRSMAQFDVSQSRFSTWLFTIAKRLAANEQQRAAHRHEALTEPSREVACPTMNPAEQAGQAETARRIQSAIRTLAEPMRSTFVFAQIEDLCLEEIAELQKCAVGTVKSRIYRAREILRSAIDDEEM